jgi:hypothetical protein
MCSASFTLRSSRKTFCAFSSRAIRFIAFARSASISGSSATKRSAR